MAAEAANVLKAAKHQGPIKVIWTREDDIKGGRYRPIFVHRLRGGIDDKGEIVGWDQVIVGQSFMKGSPFEAGMIKNGVDQTMVEGASTLPYQIPNLRVSRTWPRSACRRCGGARSARPTPRSRPRRS